MEKLTPHHPEEEPPSIQPADAGQIDNVFSPATTGSRFRLFKKLRQKLGSLFSTKRHSLEDEVAEFIEERDPEGVMLNSEERAMVHNVLRLGEIKVQHVMIPRSDIVCIEKNMDLDALKNVVLDKEHTRLPVYEDSLDSVLGFVHIKDMIRYLGSDKPFAVKNILRNVLFVPPSMKVLDLLVKMRDERTHMAIVLDEYGGTDGLVTMEDLMEEIVGEIEDEHDEIELPDIHQISDHTYEVSARASIHKLEEQLDTSLVIEGSEEDYETVGGLIFSMLGRIPDQGEVIPHAQGVEFKILDSDARRINKLLVRKAG